jgi:molecular chaperone GrpE
MNNPIEIEAVLKRFQQWLDEMRVEARTLDRVGGVEAPGDDGQRQEFGLIDLVKEFTALRQELKLETKSTRNLQEQAEALLPPLRQAIDHFRSVAPREEQAVWNAGKALAEGLATLDEALDRGRTQIEKARELLVDEQARALTAALDELLKSQSWFRRRRFRRYHEQVMEVVRRDAQGPRRQWFESLLEGYGLMQNRLRRVMQAEDIERIDCLGRQVDPELMIVVEVVDDPDLPPHTVIEEVRSGYLWRGRVVRPAEVRASREGAGESGARVDDNDDHEPEDDLEYNDSNEQGSGRSWLETH